MFNFFCSWFALKVTKKPKISQKPLFSEFIRVVDVNSNKLLDLSSSSLQELQLMNFYKKIIKFSPEDMNAVKKARFFEVLESLTKTERSKKFINMQHMDSPILVQQTENNKYNDHIEECRLFSGSEMLSKKVLYETAKLFVDKDVKLLTLPTIQTVFDNPHISNYLGAHNGFISSKGKVKKLPDSLSDLWEKDWHFTKLKGSFANVNLSIIPKQFLVYDCDLFTLLYVPDLHPFASTLTKSNPAIVVGKAKNVNMRVYALRESTKLYKRLFWNNYIKLRFDKNNVENKYDYLRTVFGRVELVPEGVAKKGFYFFKLKKKIELSKGNAKLYKALDTSINEALKKVAQLSWNSLIIKTEKSLQKNNFEFLKLYNNIYEERQLPIKLEKIRK
ncbi:hypothetical protein QEN19_002781 [Hanseniaspora menglaensis]